MKHYGIDDIFNTHTVADLVDIKVELLYDFCILNREKYTHKDPRENDVRIMLERCGTEQAMTILLHDVLMDKTSIDDLIAREVRT